MTKFLKSVIAYSDTMKAAGADRSERAEQQYQEAARLVARAEDQASTFNADNFF